MFFFYFSSKEKEELPQFHKNKDESPKIQKKIKEKIYKEEKKLNIEESSPENINITQMLNIIKSEEIRKSNKFEQKTTNLTKNNYDLPFKMSKKDVEDKKFDNQIKKYDDIILKKTTKKESNDKITEISKNLTKKNEDIKILRKEEKNDKIAFKILDIVFPVLKTNISTTPTSQEKKTMTLTPNVVPKVQKSPKEEAFEKNQKTTFRIIKKSEK